MSNNEIDKEKDDVEKVVTPTKKPVEEVVGTDEHQDKEVKDNVVTSRKPPESSAFDYDEDKFYRGEFDKTTDNAIYASNVDPASFVKATEELRQTPVGTEVELTGYVRALERASDTHGISSDKISPFSREDSFWTNSVTHEGKRIGGTRPNPTLGRRLSQQDIVLRARRKAQLGTKVMVPFWDSGVYLEMSAPSDGELHQLERSIVRLKTNLGRSQVGLNNSNISVVITTEVINTILSNVTFTTAPDPTITGLKKTLLVSDIQPLMAWAMYNIYPDGYNLVRPCISSLPSCTHISERRVNINNMIMVDDNRLTADHREFMAHRNDVRTIDEILEYRSHFAHHTRTVDLGNQTYIKLKIPTIAEFEDSGIRWIKNIESIVAKTMGESIDNKERNSAINSYAKLTTLRRHAHWVAEYGEYDDDGVENEDTITREHQTIESILDAFSEREDMTSLINEAVSKFIKESTTTAVGIPVDKCPSCGKGPHEDELHHSLRDVLQVECLSTFFTLLRDRIYSNLSRENQ